MTYYLGVHPDPAVRLATIWSIDNQKATRVDAAQEERVLSPFPNIVIEHLPGWAFHPLKLSVGEFYPRMARPSSIYFRDSPGSNPNVDKVLVETGHGQLMALREQLERIFRTVHPAPRNFEA